MCSKAWLVPFGISEDWPGDGRFTTPTCFIFFFPMNLLGLLAFCKTLELRKKHSWLVDCCKDDIHYITIILHYITLHYITLLYTIVFVHYITIHYIALFYTIVFAHYSTEHYITLFYTIVLVHYSTLRYQPNDTPCF